LPDDPASDKDPNIEVFVTDSADPVMPALSADEWVEFGDSRPFFDRLAGGGRPFGPNRRFTEEQKLHALAALALHRHPAVFTHAELGAVNTAAQFYDRRGARGDQELAAKLSALGEKIAALLPPEGVRIVGAGD
jgi:hypothetical protein